MNRDCERFDSLLLDLAYDEVPPAERAELERHAATCPRCADAFESIRLVRKLAARAAALEAPRSVDAEILRIAREAAAESSAGESRDAPVRVVEYRPTLVERLRGLLLAPALVTAVVAGLVFGVSFFLLKNARTPEESRLGEGRGAPFVGPAVRLAIPESETTAAAEEGRAVARTDLPNVEAGRSRRAEAPPSGPRLAASGQARSKDDSRLPTAESETAVAGSLANGVRQEGGGAGWPAASAASSGGDEAEAKREATKRDEAFPAAPSPAEPLERPLTGTERPSTKSKAAGDLDDLGVRQSWDVPADSSYRLGMEAYGRGDCATSIAELKKALGPGASPEHVPSALHHLGLCEKRQGRCAQALPYYEELIANHPGYPARADAIVEAAACERRLGHADRARALLGRLASEPGGAARASRALKDMGLAP